MSPAQPNRKPFHPHQVAEKLVSMLPSFAKVSIEQGTGGALTYVVRASYIYADLRVAVTDCGIDVKARRGGRGQPTRHAAWGPWDSLPKCMTMSEIALFVEGQLLY